VNEWAGEEEAAIAYRCKTSKECVRPVAMQALRPVVDRIQGLGFRVLGFRVLGFWVLG